MITRVVGYTLLGMLFIAFFLAVLGVEQVTTGEDYYAYLGSLNRLYESWRIEIPQIPSINHLTNRSFDSQGLILTVLINIANAFFTFVNIVIAIVNVLITLVNIVISIIQFVCTMLFSLKDFIGALAESNT